MSSGPRASQAALASDGERFRWVLRFERRFSPSELVPLLGLDAEIADDDVEDPDSVGEQVWVQFRAQEKKAVSIAAVSSGTLYRRDDSHRLTRLGKAVPLLSLPDLCWSPLDSQVTREMPVAVFPESLRGPDTFSASHRMGIRLEHASNLNHIKPLHAEAILVDLPDLERWVDDASASRLAKLSWCIIDNQAMVLGTPLPPIEGQHFCKLGRIVFPAGFGWLPELPAETVERILDQDSTLDFDCYHLLTPHRAVISIPIDAFHTLQRAAVRRKVSEES